MGWIKLDPAPRATNKERDLQAVFDSWADARNLRNGVSIGGLPRWLETLGAPDERTSFDSYGYSFAPDVLWLDAGYVIELKCADKFEPMALAEVLHHAEMLTRSTEHRMRPVIISSGNGWLRAALAFLHERCGVQPGSILYYEADHLRAPDGRRLIWLDAPFAAWRALPDRPSAIPPHSDDSTDAFWYEVEETRSFIALSTPTTKRPAFLEGVTTMITEVSGSPGRFLRWRGRQAILGESYSAEEHGGTYELWDL